MKQRSLSDDSDNYLENVEPQVCVISADGAIVSNISPKDFKPFFTNNSFSFQHSESCIVIQMSPIFLWKLTQQMKTASTPDYDIDFSKLITFASFFMKSTISDIRIYVYENMVSYSLDGRVKTIETDKYYPTLLLSYNYLYADVRRLYNTPEKTTEILKECSDILLLLSDPRRDKRTYTKTYKNTLYR